MDDKQAEIAKEIVEKGVQEICDELRIDELFVVNIISGTPICWKGVEVRTDGDIYDAFYEEMGGDEVLDRQFTISKKVDAALGDKEGEHYFEKYGGGVIYIF